MTSFKFSLFTATRGKHGNNTISFSKNCAVLFNSGFYQKQRLNRYKYVQLAYDEAKKAVAFIFSNARGEGIFTMIHRGNSGTIVARSFFVKNELVPKEKMKFVPQEYDDPIFGKIFYVQLGEK